MMRSTVVALVLAAVSLTACGATAPCGTSTCAGCCDASGVCRTGEGVDACGRGGLACAACAAGLVCGPLRACVTPTVSGGEPDGGATPDAGAQPRCGKTTVTCSDQVIQRLNLFTTPNTTPNALVDAIDGAGFSTEVNATAGAVGGQINPTQSFVYAKFTPNGLEQVPLSDTAALESLEWDIAFRRFIVRLNGGDSGPSCVQATIVEGTPYERVTAAPAGATWQSDDYLSDDCMMFRDDGFGLMTPPLTALTPYYNYAGCVKMTNRTFVVRTRLGRAVKFTVQRYYQTEVGQQVCETMSRAPGASAPGGYLKVRWQLLD
ncbi:MAG: HmuY family protein [Myxococcaceae bacterium]|nr:HmuY family protein [Myxococcaceae bacterium]MCA3013762.1 HmuY family protein [Myxococcaceae bacterium]